MTIALLAAICIFMAAKQDSTSAAKPIWQGVAASLIAVVAFEGMRWGLATIEIRSNRRAFRRFFCGGSSKTAQLPELILTFTHERRTATDGLYRKDAVAGRDIHAANFIQRTSSATMGRLLGSAVIDDFQDEGESQVIVGGRSNSAAVDVRRKLCPDHSDFNNISDLDLWWTPHGRCVERNGKYYQGLIYQFGEMPCPREDFTLLDDHDGPNCGLIVRIVSESPVDVDGSTRKSKALRTQLLLFGNRSTGTEACGQIIFDDWHDIDAELREYQRDYYRTPCIAIVPVFVNTMNDVYRQNSFWTKIVKRL